MTDKIIECEKSDCSSVRLQSLFLIFCNFLLVIKDIYMVYYIWCKTNERGIACKYAG